MLMSNDHNNTKQSISYLGIASEVASSKWVGRRKGGGRGYGGKRTI